MKSKYIASRTAIIIGVAFVRSATIYLVVWLLVLELCEDIQKHFASDYRVVGVLSRSWCRLSAAQARQKSLKRVGESSV